MSPDTFKTGRRALKLSQNALAKLFELAPGSRTVRRWESGKRDIPGPAQVLMKWLMTGKRPL